MRVNLFILLVRTFFPGCEPSFFEAQRITRCSRKAQSGKAFVDVNESCHDTLVMQWTGNAYWEVTQTTHCECCTTIIYPPPATWLIQFEISFNDKIKFHKTLKVQQIKFIVRAVSHDTMKYKEPLPFYYYGG